MRSSLVISATYLVANLVRTFLLLIKPLFGAPTPLLGRDKQNPGYVLDHSRIPQALFHRIV